MCVSHGNSVEHVVTSSTEEKAVSQHCRIAVPEVLRTDHDLDNNLDNNVDNDLDKDLDNDLDNDLDDLL